MFITKKRHNEIVRGLACQRDACAVVARQYETERNAARASLDNTLDQLAAEQAKTLAVQQLNTSLRAELNHWRQHGQMRDPKTGRLVPRGKMAAKSTAFDGLVEKDGKFFYNCGTCDEMTEWDGDPADFQHGHRANVCGRSPRCCP